MMCAVERSLLCLEEGSVVDETTSIDWPPVHHDDDDDGDDGVDTGRSACRRAFHCPTLSADDRVLANLLATERHSRPAADCFCRQPEVLPYMRDTVVSWMLEVRITLIYCCFAYHNGVCVCRLLQCHGIVLVLIRMSSCSRLY